MIFWVLFSLIGLCAAGYLGYSGTLAIGTELARFAAFGFAILFAGSVIATLLSAGRPHAR
jgi:hypothetical protein